MTAAVRTLADLELAGNALCLDFANTINSRQRPTHDYLGSYQELLRWAEYAGALSAGSVDIGRSRAAAVRRDEVLAEAHRLRDAIYGVYSAIAGARPPSAAAIATIGDAYGTAVANAAITGSDGRPPDPEAPRYELTWPNLRSPEAPLWPVAHSAGELLLAGNLTRIGECPGCGWLFVDVSRNGTRRWCSMATCGSRDKMARYHRRPHA